MIKKTKRSTQWIAKTKKSRYAGIHLLAEFWGGKIIDNSKELEKILFSAAKTAKATPLKASIHKFLPHGITGVILLAESHIAVHVWPEYNYTAIDIFTCGDKSSPYKAFEYLKKTLKPKRVEVKQLDRGKLL